MAINNNDIKNKFGTLLSVLHTEGFLDDAIDNGIIESTFFDCFENNNVNLFVNTGIEEIIQTVFSKSIYVDYNKALISEYYWAGQSYIQIMLNSNVPLKRALMLLPLKDMIDLYPVYHEMNPVKIRLKYKEIEDNVSILKVIRNINGYSIRKLSFLTGIKEITLATYDKSNEKLFNASSNNINKLLNVFNISKSIFNKESSYVPYFEFMFEDKEFVDLFLNNICEYLNIDIQEIKSIVYLLDSKTIKKDLKKYKKLIYIKKPGIIYSSRKVQQLEEKEYLSLFKKTIAEIINMKSNENYY